MPAPPFYGDSFCNSFKYSTKADRFVLHAFSLNGLITQLEYEQFSTEDQHMQRIIVEPKDAVRCEDVQAAIKHSNKWRFCCRLLINSKKQTPETCISKVFQGFGKNLYIFIYQISIEFVESIFSINLPHTYQESSGSAHCWRKIFLPAFPPLRSLRQP